MERYTKNKRKQPNNGLQRTRKGRGETWLLLFRRSWPRPFRSAKANQLVVVRMPSRCRQTGRGNREEKIHFLPCFCLDEVKNSDYIGYKYINYSDPSILSIRGK